MSRATSPILTMPTTPISSVTPDYRYPREDEVDYSDSNEDKDNTDGICEETTVDSPEPRERSMGTERHSMSNTQDGGKAKPLYASDDRPDLPERSLVIQEDTTKARKGSRESVPSTNPRSRSGTYNPARWFCEYVNTPAGCTKRHSSTFSHQHKGTKCFKFEEHGWCPNKTCVFVHDDNYTRGHRFERYYR
jgi:hypothetical protein